MSRHPASEFRVTPVPVNRKDVAPSHFLKVISTLPPLTVACVAIFLTLTIGAVFVWPMRARVLVGANDFLSFYAGAKLAGSTDLYNPKRIRQVQMQSTGMTADLLRFIRLPYYAGVLWPLGRLPYRHAYYVWQLLAFAALAIFVALWHRISRHAALLFCASSVPVHWSFTEGQDLMFLLVWIALSVQLHRRGRFFSSGLILSLCAAKYNLFLLVPLVLWKTGKRRLGYGFLAGSTILVVMSFILSGPQWPSAYWHNVVQGRIHPGMDRAPNLYGLAGLFPFAQFVKWAVLLSVVAAVWLSTRLGFEPALASAVAASMFVAPHFLIQDAALLVPVALLVLATPATRITHGFALYLLLPFQYVFEFALPFPWGLLFAVNVLCFVYSLAWESFRHAGRSNGE